MDVRSVQNGKTSYTRRKWTPDEMAKIQGIAAAVIGFDPKRGDTITVQNMSFDSDPMGSDLPALNWMDEVRKIVEDYASLLRPVSLLVLFLLAYMFVVRPIQKQALSPDNLRLVAQSALPVGAARDRLGAGSMDMGDSPETATKLKDQTVEHIKQRPINTALAVQTWLREEPS
jgi:flagellar M-ring protein FliF